MLIYSNLICLVTLFFLKISDFFFIGQASLTFTDRVGTEPGRTRIEWGPPSEFYWTECAMSIVCGPTDGGVPGFAEMYFPSIVRTVEHGLSSS